MLGVELDELVQRETTRRHRRMAWLVTASLGGMVVTSTLAVEAFQARNEAREQRREAEGLVAFMLGDLKNKLEPIGRLDALDGVGSRVLAYYSKQDTSELTDAALSQRSKALSLMAQVANSRGDSKTALKLYRQAMAGTAETVRRNPTDAEAIFDHAQNVFYVGEIAQLAGDYAPAEAGMREYQRLARRMVALQPDSMKYRMEEQYADADLGIVLYDQRRFGEAVTQFDAALTTMEAISTADPTNKAYRQEVAEALAWLADAERANGHYDRAIQLRQRNVALDNQADAQFRDVKFRERVVPAHRALGWLYAERGQVDLASQQFQASIDMSNQLRAIEPNNASWAEGGAHAQLFLARLLLVTGKRAEAASQLSTACQTYQLLLNRPSPRPEWRKAVFACMSVKAELALSNGAKDQAFDLGQRALRAAQSVHTADKFEDTFRVARAYRLIGDIERARGNGDAAQADWSKGLAAIAAGVPEQPDEMAEHASLLQRLGRTGEARPLAAKLTSMGYRLQM
jgi:tetratricopeptide (TPR) repeat protein